MASESSPVNLPSKTDPSVSPSDGSKSKPWISYFEYLRLPTYTHSFSPPPASAVPHQQPPTPSQTSTTSSASSPPLPTSLPPPAFSGINKNDPAHTGYDPASHWFVNYAKILTGRITPEGAFHFREDRYRALEASDCARCEKYRDWLFEYSPVVRFLRDRIADLNGTLNARNVVCRRCPARLEIDPTIPEGRRGDNLRVYHQAGGFSPDHGILICANEMRDRGHMEDTLVHEMVHAWDHLRFKVDFVGQKDLRHAACTEIRATMLSGECRWSREAFIRGNLSIARHFQNCVRTRAVESVKARPRCKDEAHALKIVNEVWDSCFADTRPFDDIFK